MPGKRANTMASKTAMAPQPAPRQSLCATHPSNYAMPPPPHPPKRTYTATSNERVPKSVNGYPTPSPSPPQTTQDFVPQYLQAKQPRSSPQTEQQLPQPARRPAESTTGNRANGQKPELPWEMHADPTFTTSDAPPFWSRNCTVLKSDTELSNGVISPSAMIGLPCGGMIEMAYHYPSEERLAGLDDHRR